MLLRCKSLCHTHDYNIPKAPAPTGQIFPELTIAPDELAKRRAQRAYQGDLCRQVFERVRPSLLKEHYDWFIAIEPENEEYLIEPSLMDLIQKVCDRYDRTGLRLTIFRLNEAG